ncbi:hypothetical protein K438DRAFT_1956074 [Mycena galopus ATCC 62051]|nr:hypothetical protein K438DRAFT_1956074 [Mycena galopus ATCC 62051]
MYSIIALVAKFAYHVLELFYAVPVFYRGELKDCDRELGYGDMEESRDRGISSLANELLEAIAAAGQEGHDYSRSFKAEWTFSQVLRHFRDIIIGARALWTQVATDFGYVEILKLYLERSLPLSTSVAMWHSTLTDTRFDERLTQIVPHISRTSRLSIVLDTDSMGLLAAFRDIAAPKLRHLEIVKDDLYRPSC